MTKLTEKEDVAINKIIEFENGLPDDAFERPNGKFNLGWGWTDVRVHASILNNLVIKGCLDILFKSNSYTGYRLTDVGRAMIIPINDNGDKPEKKEIDMLSHDDMFSDIIGYDDVKELLRAVIFTQKPVHVLLSGPPALAKTLFLWGIERNAGNRALWLVGSAASKAGIWDLVAEREPDWLLVDELDKMSAVDTAGLLSMMEGGRLVRVKKGRGLDITVPIKVVAATNNEMKLSKELRSRFAIRRLNPYTGPKYAQVVKGVLMRHEGMDADSAEKIGELLNGKTQDVRDAVRVARLSGQVGIARAVELLIQQ